MIGRMMRRRQGCWGWGVSDDVEARLRGSSVCIDSYLRFRCECEACEGGEDDGGEMHGVDRCWMFLKSLFGLFRCGIVGSICSQFNKTEGKSTSTAQSRLYVPYTSHHRIAQNP